MIVIRGFKFGFPIERVWYWHSGLPIDSTAHLVRLLRVTEGEADEIVLPHKKEQVNTLISDLSQGEEILWSKLNKNYRYEIRRALKEDIKITEFDAEAIKASPLVLEEFELTYKIFSEQLGNEDVKNAYDRNKVLGYIENNCILLTRARKDKAVVYHLYVFDGVNTTLCFSASDFRDAAVDKAMAGRMNKLLHWHDMQSFMEKRVHYYDWGNVSNGEPENYNGIDRFKAGFGGVPTKLENVFIGNRILGRIYIRFLQRQ